MSIYKPKGKALEYGEYALNINLFCTHSCKYCYCPSTIKTNREEFYQQKEHRKKILENTQKWLNKNTAVKGKHIFLSFIGDPFMLNNDNTITCELIDIIHKSGNFVQILTKGLIKQEEYRCLTENDIVGITISCGDELAEHVESGALKSSERLKMLQDIKTQVGCKTFVSCEPVIEPTIIFDIIENCDFIDQYKIGKLNYAKPSDYGVEDIDWKSFGTLVENSCKINNCNYYIKESLQKEMEKNLK